MELPNWAYRKALPEDWLVVQKFKAHIKTKILFTDKALKRWMDYNGWKRSWFSSRNSFFKTLFANELSFQKAIQEEVLEIQVPEEVHVMTDQDLEGYDQDYTNREWAAMVLALREYRRLIEAGVVVKIGGEDFSSVSKFLTWVHARYHLLEEGTDRWVGSDE